MSSLKDAARDFFENKLDANFSIERGGRIIGNMKGLQTRMGYIQPLSLNPDIAVGDYLINGHNQRFLITEIATIQGRTRVYYSE